MNIDNSVEKELKKEILKIVGKYLDLNVYKIFFFGSRVRGDNFERADIDLGIEGPEKIPGHIKVEIDDRVKKIETLYKIDVVDFKEVSEDFRKEALKNIEYVK